MNCKLADPTPIQAEPGHPAVRRHPALHQLGAAGVGAAHRHAARPHQGLQGGSGPTGFHTGNGSTAHPGCELHIFV